jgi:F-type H+/Na+-transporting ATPase subunit alpha
MFASDLDPASRAQLARGSRLVELLKQRQYSPYPMEEQVVAIFAGTSGLLDDVPVEDVRRFERELLEQLRREGKILTTIRETRQFGDDTEQALRDVIDEFKRNFVGGERPSVAPGHETAEALDAEDVDQERIVRQRRG